MAALKVRVDYNGLSQMAQEFSNRADIIRQQLQLIQQAKETLQSGDWVGRGADTFYQEMNSDVIPSLKRLALALGEAAQVVRQTSRVMKQAEDEAAALFKGDGGPAGGETIGGEGQPGRVVNAPGPAAGNGPEAAAAGGSTRGPNSGAPQPTLAEAARQGITLQASSLERMDVERLFKMSLDERQAWYMQKLGPYAGQIQESAKKYGIPAQLLTTLLLNELADINWIDTVQNSGSLGIAQLQIDTVIEHDLMPELKHWDDGTDMPHGGRDADVYNRVGVAHRLQVPQHAIDAAAKEISLLLARASQNTGKPWQQKFGFKGLPGQPADGGDWYSAIDGPTLAVRQGRLAQMTAAAYNSPDILITSDPSEERYPNANAHGSNAASIAGDLFQMAPTLPVRSGG